MSIFRWQTILTRVSPPSQKTIYNFKLAVGHTTKHMKLSHVSHACMGDKSNCSVTCTLFKIAFLGKWDGRGERPFLWPLTSFSDRHTYSVHSVQYRLSSCFEQFCWDWDLSRTGQKKHTCQKQINPFIPFDRTPTCDRQTDTGP